MAWRSSTAVWLVLLLAGCQNIHTQPQRWVSTELYFGLSRQGEVITEDQWRHFLDHEVTPRFPDGLSVVDTHGQWKNRDGAIVRESGKLLIILHPPAAETDRKIEALRRLYRQQFQQESVLRSDSDALVSF